MDDSEAGPDAETESPVSVEDDRLTDMLRDLFKSGGLDDYDEIMEHLKIPDGFVYAVKNCVEQMANEKFIVERRKMGDDKIEILNAAGRYIEHLEKRVKDSKKVIGGLEKAKHDLEKEVKRLQEVIDGAEGVMSELVEKEKDDKKHIQDLEEMVQDLSDQAMG